VQAAQIDRRREPLRLGARLGADREHAQQRVRRILARGRHERRLVGLHHRVAALRGDEVREREPQPEEGGEAAAVVGRAEQPDLRRGVARGHRLHPRERMVGRERGVEESDQVAHLLREILRERVVPARDRLRGDLVAPGRAPDAEVDAAREERLEHAEHLGDLERAVVGQEHAAGADANALRRGRDAREQDFGTGIGEGGDRVMLGEPVARVAEPVGRLRERHRFRDRPRGGVPADHRALVEDAETHSRRGAHSAIQIRPATSAASATDTQKMPIMRCLSVQVMPSFFFRAMLHSARMISIPIPNVTAAHLTMVGSLCWWRDSRP
jgi:hypothetical protein